MQSRKDQWIKDLPRSRMEYPDAMHDRLKYWVWRFYTPFHPFVRDTSVSLGIVKHEVRQDFLLGTLAPSCSVRELALFLTTQGFGNHFVAWKDSGELVSLRRTEGFKRQYHVRVFADGEVRCHYEYTPECHPVLHLLEIDMVDKRDYFTEMLRDWIVPISNEQ